MSVRPIKILEHADGRTFAESGLVAIRENAGIVRRERDRNKLASKRGIAVVRAFDHECIHFLQALTCGYLYDHSLQYVDACSRVVARIGEPSSWNRAAVTSFHEATWERAHEPGKRVEVHDRCEGVLILPIPVAKTITTADILEGVADLASFQRTTRGGAVKDYLIDLGRRYPGDDGVTYWNAFRYVADELGAELAYASFCPLSFVALNSVDPPAALVRCVEEVKPLGNKLPEACKDLDALCKLGGATLENHYVYQTAALPVAQQHPTLLPCLEQALQVMSPLALLTYAANPGAMNEAPPEHVAALHPPVVVMSSGEDWKVSSSRHGRAATDETFAALVLQVTALCGAVERLIRPAEPRYQFCPHADCSHYESALCFQYFTPPSIERGLENCQFPVFFKASVEAVPAEVWRTGGFARISVAELVAEFQATGEASILALVRKRKWTIVAWLGESGFEQLEWKCEAVAEKVMRALQTNKIDDLVMARAFRDAVVKEVTDRTGGA